MQLKNLLVGLLLSLIASSQTYAQVPSDPGAAGTDIRTWAKSVSDYLQSQAPGGAGTLLLTVTDPNVNNDANDLAAMRLNCTNTAAVSNPNFSNEDCLEIGQTILHGQQSYGGGTNAKKTFAPLAITSTATGAGQRFLNIGRLDCYGMGDCFGKSETVTFAGADTAGDEGQGFQSVSALTQQRALTLSDINSVPAQTTCNTTLTQNVTASKDVQSVTVASSTNCNIDDWVVLGQAVNNGSPNISAVQIMAVSAGHISAAIRNNYSSGTTVTPAKVLVVSSTYKFGQDRVLVNLSGASYSTGTVSAISGGGMDGSGTTWTTSMVGGGATNIGCIALTADDYTGVPFGAGAFEPLKSWYEVVQVTTTTHLAIHSFSVAGDVSYRGKGPGAGGYIIRPCARVLRVVDENIVILESTATTWTIGDIVEMAISPYPDVAGFQYRIAGFTPGGTYRSFFDIRNNGARTFETGIFLGGLMQTGSNSDYPFAWGTGLQIEAARVGVTVGASEGLAYRAMTSSTSPFSATATYTFGGGDFGGGGTNIGLRGNGITSDIDLVNAVGTNIQLRLRASDGMIVLSNPLRFTTDNTKNIGAPGAERPATGYFGTSVISPLFQGAYKSSDGSTGATVTTCTAFKDGLCISGS